MKTVAAFGNGQGGTLLIGVNDDGEVLGLEGDYHALGGANRDKFELHLRNLLNGNFGTAFVTSKIKVSFPIVGELELCEMDVLPSVKPLVISVRDKNGQAQEKKFTFAAGTRRKSFH
jgi:hypothetical protein